MLIGTIPSAFAIQPRLRSDAALPAGGVRFSTLVPKVKDAEGDDEFEIFDFAAIIFTGSHVLHKLNCKLRKFEDECGQFFISFPTRPAHGFGYALVVFSCIRFHVGLMFRRPRLAIIVVVSPAA